MGMRNSGIVHFGIAQNGLLAYVAGAPRSRQSRMVWRSRDGRTEPLAAPVSGYLNPRVSPDGTQIAAQIEGGTTFDIWTYHLEQDTLTRLTFEGDNTNPIWSPDGRRIAFSSVRDNALMAAYVKDADGSGPAELIFSPMGLEKAGQVMPRDWTADGRTMIVQFTNEKSINLATFSEETDEFQVLLETPATEAAPALSPNGRWLAYISDDSGEFQIFVRAFPGPGGKWQVSTDGGAAPRWSPDGTELYYRWQSELHAVAVDDSGGSFRVKSRELLFDDLTTTTAVLDYDVLDADRFLLVERAGDDTDPPGVTVVVNWLSELERRIPD
jgi:serine/threonine-protein kinase